MKPKFFELKSKCCGFCELTAYLKKGGKKMRTENSIVHSVDRLEKTISHMEAKVVELERDIEQTKKRLLKIEKPKL